MKVGISTACFYPNCTIEESLEKIKAMSFNTCEVFINTFCEAEEDYILNLKEIADNNKIEVNSVHGFSGSFEPYLFDKYKRRQEDMLKYFKKLCKASEILGSNIYTFHGIRTNDINNIDLKMALDVMEEMYYIAGEHNVKIALENVSYCMGGSLEFLNAILEKSKVPLYFTLDIKQAYKSNIRPSEYINIMGDKIINLHINDRSRTEKCLLPGQGDVEISEILKQLRGFGYNGNGIIEVYSSNFRENDDIINSKIYVEALVKRLNRIYCI